MLDNEYLTQYLVRERLREAEASGALHSALRQASMLRRARHREASRDDARPGWFGLWWQMAVARAAHLALPKSRIRL